MGGKKKKKKRCVICKILEGGKKHLPNSSKMVPMCSQNIKKDSYIVYLCV